MQLSDFFPEAVMADKIFMEYSRMERWQSFPVGQLREIARKEAVRRIAAEKEVKELIAVPASQGSD